MSLSESDKKKLERYNLKGLNKPKRTPDHPTKKGIVATRVDGKVKIITTYNSNNIKSYSKNGLQTILPLQIEIIDYGRGIPSDILPNIFDPFVTSKKDGKGLGLSVVSSGLEEMGANIDVSSDNGSTCFRINFPQRMN